MTAKVTLLCFSGHRRFPTDLSALLLGDLYYTRLSLSGVSEHLSHTALLDLYQILNANLSSNISKVCNTDKISWHECAFIFLSHLFLSQVRLLTLRILSQFEAELPPQPEVRPSVETLLHFVIIHTTTQG